MLILGEKSQPLPLVILSISCVSLKSIGYARESVKMSFACAQARMFLTGLHKFYLNEKYFSRLQKKKKT